MDLDPPPHPPKPPPPPPPWGAVNGGGYDESSFPLPRKHSVQDGWKIWKSPLECMFIQVSGKEFVSALLKLQCAVSDDTRPW